MAKTTIEVPWVGMVFPQKCASCGNPMVAKTVRIKRPTQEQQRRQSTGYFLGGVIGMAIANAGAADKSIQFDIPFCQDCVARNRKLRIAGWVTLVLGLLSVILLPVAAAALSLGGDSGTWIALSMLLAALLLIAAVVLFVMVGTRTPTSIKAVKDKFWGAVLSFRNPEYAEEFRQINLPRLIPYELRAGLPLSVPPEQALAVVSQNIDDDRPDSLDTVAGHFHRAQILMRGEAHSQAVDDLQQVLAFGGQNPFVPEAYFLRAQALLNLARYPEAAADLEIFIQFSGDPHKVREAKKLLKKVSAYR